MNKTTKTLSMTPAAVRARAKRAAQKEDAATLSSLKALDREANRAAEQEVTASPFTAMVATLTADQTAEAAATTQAAIKKAKAAAPTAVKAPSVKPTDNTRYTVGAYKGRAGAMFEFMKRAGRLLEQFPHGYTREQFVTSCTAGQKTAPHPMISTRAQVLDYFAWAVRNGLIVVDASALPAEVVKVPKIKGAGKGVKKAAQKLSSLLVA